MKASTLLRKAKKHLRPSSLPAEDTSSYICLALSHAADSSKRNWGPTLDRLRYHIGNALHPYENLRSWLQGQLPKETGTAPMSSTSKSKRTAKLG